MICSCCFFPKRCFFILGMAYADLFLAQIGPEKAIFVEVLPNVFQNYWIATEVTNINWIL